MIVTPGVVLLEVGWEALVFLAIFPSPPTFRLLIFPFILASVHCPSSTCRVNISKVDICPISLHSKSFRVFIKVKECGSVRFRELNGSKGSFPWIFLDLSPRFQPYAIFALLSGGTVGLPRTELPSAVPKGYLAELGLKPSSAWAFGFSPGKWVWPINHLGPTIYIC